MMRACEPNLGLIEATEEPRGQLARLFKDEVLPPADDEGL
jgi:hypothetical protein